MVRYSPGRSRLVAAALGALLLVCTFPATSWLVGAQMRAPFIGVPGVPQLLSDPWMKDIAARVRDGAPDDCKIQAEAGRHPADYRMQIAAAIWLPVGSSPNLPAERVRRLEALISRFPDRPALYAHILRFASAGPVNIVRPELYELSWSGKYVDTRPSPSRAALEDFDRIAKQGERLDPANAYFPMMRAAGLFAGHRDPEAIEAVERASRKPGWNDYVYEQSASSQHLFDETFGSPGGISDTIVALGTSLPHMALIRDVGRVAIAVAVRWEIDARKNPGTASECIARRKRAVELRLAIMRCGGLMRADSTTFVGSLIGVAMARIATARPGGEPVIQRAGSDPDSARRHQARFLKYLAANSSRENVEWAARELAAGDSTKPLIHKFSQFDAIFTPYSLIACWIVDLCLLSNGLWLLLLSGVASIRWRMGLRSAFLIAIITFVLVTLAWTPTWITDMDALLSAYASMSYQRSWINLLSYYPGCAGPTFRLLSVMAPLTLLAGWTAAALRRRQRLSAALSRRLGTTGLGAACVLLLLYTVMVAVTARVERSDAAARTRALSEGGRYFAAELRMKWPGAIPFPGAK